MPHAKPYSEKMEESSLGLKPTQLTRAGHSVGGSQGTDTRLCFLYRGPDARPMPGYTALVVSKDLTMVGLPHPRLAAIGLYSTESTSPLHFPLWR